MILTKINLLLVLIIIGILFKRNYAATEVLYEIRIREEHSDRNETAVIKDKNTPNSELIITGARRTTILIKNEADSIYTETTIYTANKDGYKAKFNYSIKPLGIEPRIGSQALKDIVG